MDVLHAKTEGVNDGTLSEASVTKLQLNIAGNSIYADVVMAAALAECCECELLPEIKGTSRIVGLIVNGQGVSVSGTPNQEVSLLGGTLIINEQTGKAEGNEGDMTVNALHVKLGNVADVIISSASAGITCFVPPPPPPEPPQPPPPSVPPPPEPPPGDECHDDVSGRGWTEVEGIKITFNLSCKLDKKGNLKGRLQCKDKARKVIIKGKKILVQTRINETTRIIDFEAVLNKEPCIARVVVADVGTAGADDVFGIVTSNGYGIIGDLGATNPGRGNNKVKSR